jgi:hypothetical protein
MSIKMRLLNDPDICITIRCSGPGMRGEMQAKKYDGDAGAAREGANPGR